jgi:hypothetical protein
MPPSDVRPEEPVREIANVSRFNLSPTARRLVRSYGLLVLVAIAFLLMAMLVRERPETVPVESIGLEERVTLTG